MKFTSTTFAAWSCTVRLTIADRTALAPAAMDLVALMIDVDAAANRFRSDSELSRANRWSGRPVPISHRLSDYVGIALDAARDTDGAVDPTIGRRLIELGYDRDIEAIRGRSLPARSQRFAAQAKSWRDVRLDRHLGLLTVPVGAALDLGATAKAYTADLAAGQLARRYDTPVLVEIGGDLAVSGSPPDGWVVDVAERAGGPGQRIALHRGGIATSTTTLRHWEQGGQARHHIVDPRTGRPAEGRWRTASVAADSALAANVASTAAIVLGDAAADWLIEHDHTARLIDRAGHVHPFGHWPADARPHSTAA